MKIVLLGYMGSGKSLIGKELAKKNTVDFIDLDDFIEKKEGRPIITIFKEDGEIYFRKIESKYLNEVMCLAKNCVVSLGGGTPCFGSNMEVVLKNSISFYLNASAEVLNNRLSNERVKRPLLSNVRINLVAYIAKHIFERNRYYKKANFIINVNQKTPKEIVEEINSNLK